MTHDQNASARPLRILAPEGHPLTRRSFISLAAATTAGVAVAGAAGASDPLAVMESAAKKSLKAAGKTTKSLYLYTWGQYDNPTTFTAWQKGAGFAVQIGSYDSNEALIAKLELAKGTAGYDIVVPTGGYIPEMVAKGLLMKIDHSKIPNLAGVDPNLLNFPWDRGNKYSVPKDFGTTGFIYDTTVIKKNLKSWQDFADAAKLPAVSGRVSLLDDPDDVIGIPLWIEGVDWNTTDASKIRKANNWLIKNLAPHIKALDSYPGATGGLTNGSYVLSQAWNGDARSAIIKDPKRFKWVVPTPKTEIWVDNWSIAKGAKNVNTAHAFLNFVLDPHVSANEMQYTGYNTAVKNVQNYLPKNTPATDVIFLTAAQRKIMVAYVVNSSFPLRTQLYANFKAAVAS
ncbi:MAG: spermidine/putrescine ABC transporter substrate-binding protein [Acidobacteriota bacterium]|nr:spermidine/putrescine ABC transporter substrate-binding protein [Acidobacteriota bacterium]